MPAILGLMGCIFSIGLGLVAGAVVAAAVGIPSIVIQQQQQNRMMNLTKRINAKAERRQLTSMKIEQLMQRKKSIQLRAQVASAVGWERLQAERIRTDRIQKQQDSKVTNKEISIPSATAIFGTRSKGFALN